MNVKCMACGKRYDYHEHGCCPECGAYNRPPQRNRVDADGTVHHMSDEEFFSNSPSRRRSQSGKVCFERDVCYEDQARRVRQDSPFDTPVTRAKSKKRKTGPEIKRNSARVIAGIIIAIMVANIVPAFFTMHSVGVSIGGFVEDLFDGDSQREPPAQIVPTTPVDGQYPAAIGSTFLWWDEKTLITEVSMDEQEGVTELQLTVQTSVDYDAAMVRYLLPDGTEVDTACDEMTCIEDDLWSYYYLLPDRVVGSECWAIFSGESAGEWRETVVPVATNFSYSDPMDPDGELPVETYYAEVGQLFLWEGYDACVVDTVVNHVGKYTDVSVTMHRYGGYTEPTFFYVDEGGNEVEKFCDSAFMLGTGVWVYECRLTDREADGAIYLMCAEDSMRTRVLLDGSTGLSGTIGECVILEDTEISVQDVTFKTAGNSTTIVLYVERSDDFFGNIPVILYTTTNGTQKEAESNTYWAENNVAVYTFKMRRLDADQPIYARFTGHFSGNTAQILLNG